MLISISNIIPNTKTFPRFLDMISFSSDLKVFPLDVIPAPKDFRRVELKMLRFRFWLELRGFEVWRPGIASEE